MSNANSLSYFKQKFNGGTRQNRFEVEGNWPSIITENPQTCFHVVSASMPQSDVGIIQIPYRGRVLNIAGDREYEAWNLVVYDDTGTNSLWKAFTSWSNRINKILGNVTDSNNLNFTRTKTNWKVRQLNTTNNGTLRELELLGCWPASVGALNFNASNVNPVVFNVTMNYDQFRITKYS